MLRAGTTIQTVVRENGVNGPFERIYCASHIAIASTENTSLDAQLQTAGRTFAELKHHDAPKNWKINVLGVKSIVETLKSYAEMESILSNINTGTSLMEYKQRIEALAEEEKGEEEQPNQDEQPDDIVAQPSSPSSSSSAPSAPSASSRPSAPSPTPTTQSLTSSSSSTETRYLTLPEALKESFDSTLVAENEYGDLGKVGVRRGDFASILGLTSEVAKRRAKAAKEARKKLDKTATTTAERDAQARRSLRLNAKTVPTKEASDEADGEGEEGNMEGSEETDATSPALTITTEEDEDGNENDDGDRSDGMGSPMSDAGQEGQGSPMSDAEQEGRWSRMSRMSDSDRRSGRSSPASRMSQ